jgi:hypothetical protein
MYPPKDFSRFAFLFAAALGLTDVPTSTGRRG